MASSSRQRMDDPRWYERAVFYELLPRGFYDSNADGIGDFEGLREKLDYLEWLGVDCLWLLPFYPSPLRDGGYDISDFLTVAPEFGTIDDLAAVVEDAHRRGIRIISDLVMNHTSDQHPWFVESRSSRDNAEADWYVWADDDHGFADVRVIFLRRRAVQLDLRPETPAVLLASLLPPPARPELRQPRGRRCDARGRPLLARPRHRRFPARRRPVPVQGRGDGVREPARDPPAAAPDPGGDRRLLPQPGPARRGQPVAGRRRRVLRRRRRVPHVLPLPAHAAHVHGDPAGAALPDHRDPRPDPRRSPTAASGGSSCATTTSSPWRW